MRHGLRFEALEERHLMAGDVTVEVARGQLLIRGDAEDNWLRVEQSDGAYIVTPTNDTTINGAADPYKTSDVKRGVDVRLGDGNNSIELENLDVAGGLSIRTGNGNDTVQLVSGSVRGDLRVDTGAGDDTVRLGNNPLVTPSPYVRQDVSRASLKVRHNTFIDLGAGDNSLSVTSAQIGGSLWISGGEQSDQISLGVFGGPRNAVTARYAAPLGVTVGQSLSVWTKGGDDVARLNQVDARAAVFVMGDGADTLAASNTHFDLFFAALGDGADSLDLSGGENQIGWFLVLGGDGEDTFTGADSNKIGHKWSFGFEKTS